MIKLLKTRIYSLYKIFLYASGKAKVYHAGKNKAKVKIAWELLSWLLNEGYFNVMYFAFGLNITGSKQSDFIGSKEVLLLKNKAENKLKQKANCKEFNYDVITKDKFYANAILTANHIACIEDQAVISNSQVLFKNGECKNLDALFNMKGQVFIKNTTQEAGDGVLVCEIKDQQIYLKDQKISLEELKRKLEGGKWVVQLAKNSHPQVKKINNSALNTTRIVTILDGTEPVYLTGFQSFATNNEKTDSWSKGSIYVGIDIQNNCLKKYGYFHPEISNMGLVEKHPDSGIIFEGYEISELQHAVDLCLRAHKLFYFNSILGWDVAITENGPLILEVNEKPGMNAVQCVDGGLKKVIKNKLS